MGKSLLIIQVVMDTFNHPGVVLVPFFIAKSESLPIVDYVSDIRKYRPR